MSWSEVIGGATSVVAAISTLFRTFWPAEDHSDHLKQHTTDLKELAEKLRNVVSDVKDEFPRPYCAPAEIASARKQLNSQPGFFHIAIVGGSGAGRTSLIKALRGLKATDPEAARFDVSSEETTRRYLDSDSKVIWHDIPCGDGKSEVWGHDGFAARRFFAFDALLLLWDSLQGQLADQYANPYVAILKWAAIYEVPRFVLLNECDQAFRRIRERVQECLRDDSGFSDDGSSAPDIESSYASAVKRFQSTSQRTLNELCVRNKLPFRKLFFVSEEGVCNVMTASQAKHLSVFGSRPQFCSWCSGAHGNLDEELFLQSLASCVASGVKPGDGTSGCETALVDTGSDRLEDSGDCSSFSGLRRLTSRSYRRSAGLGKPQENRQTSAQAVGWYSTSAQASGWFSSFTSRQATPRADEATLKNSVLTRNDIERLFVLLERRETETRQPPTKRPPQLQQPPSPENEHFALEVLKAAGSAGAAGVSFVANSLWGLLNKGDSRENQWRENQRRVREHTHFYCLPERTPPEEYY
eukprot:Gregarina_sp_Pseudo_9__259@NODE_1166_length_1817_cov_7_357705_g1092_i0_p1_GENE_NODE_1166_length_1817_cov_7_357705_g1092_i0NODE_1166_length_1817_cov_7_357705_g1092_i0_p1_ORF_typecomplete_len556_score41_05IIGP/PF05049_13/3_7e16GTP_EFTU/PF00009_27/0_12MMR_HSR1/PF01926_23/2_8e03MMR_HSR1/PF01926_23/0_02AAA_28/PF13521_6/0_017AAA_28/PF13521_6/7_8e03ABC_tran/PF00005_27/0_013Septin/PF00735_18/0_077PduVEutP/PF10662_9/0_13PduVEutP/PF10662_9/1e04RsgA_GTPase/PF03193_16/0_12Bac_DnaA/PF00308_18/0_16SLATT_4/PF1